MKKIFLVLTSILILLVSNSVGAQTVPGIDPEAPMVTELTTDGSTVIAEGCVSSTVVIKGANFTGATAVTVNGVAVASYTVTNSTTITATFPSTATTGLIRVTTPRGTASSAGNFAIVASTTDGSVTTSICAGETYVWPATGLSYDTAQTGLTHIVGCNTATLNLTITPISDNVTTAAACGSYTWANNGQTYTTSGIKVGTTTNCVTEKLDLTITPAPNAGTNGTLSLTASPSDAELFAALTGADAGGSWTRPSSGFVGVYTYTVSAASPCTENATSIVTVSAASQIPTGPLSFCTGATVATVTAGTTLKFYDGLTGGTVKATNTALTSKTWYVTEVLSTGLESTPRTAVVTTVNTLPAKPSTLVLTNDNAVLPALPTIAVTAVGVFVGTNTPLKLTATPGIASATATAASSYKWTLPTGVVRTNSTGTTTDSSTTSTDAFIYVKFTVTGVATPLVINVQSVNAAGCTSALKPSASLTRLLPTAPGALAMNNGLNTTAITTFAKYMGSPTVLRLSATAAVTATSYLWELPTGVNRMTALEGGSITTDLTSTDPFIFVNFAGVTKDNTDTNTTVLTTLTKVLRIGVKSVNGVGLSVTSNATAANPATDSTAKLLTLTAVAPAAPASLAMNNEANTAAITVISKMIGQGATVKLLAPISVLASSYAWEIPACVTRVASLTDSTPASGTTPDPFIFVKFNGTNPGPGSIYFGVTAVNGVGSSYTNNQASTVIPASASTAKLLKLTTVVPSAPTAIVLNDGTLTTGITVISKFVGQGGTYRLSAAVPVATLANSFEWELPSCVTRVTDLGGLTADVTNTSTTPEIFVKFNGTNPAAGFVYFGVKAVNSVGSSFTSNSTASPVTSSTAKLLKLATAVPAAPSTLVLNELASATAVTVVSKYIGTSTRLKLTAGVSVLANTYQWTLPSGVNRVDESDNILTGTSTTDSFIFVNFASAPATTPLVFGVNAVNSVGASIAKTLNVTAGLPAKVAAISGSLTVCDRAQGFTYTITAPVGAKSYIITAPVGSVVSSTSVPNNTSNVLTTSDLTFKVVYNATPFSTTDKYLAITSVNDFGNSATGFKSAALIKLTDCSTLTGAARIAAKSVTEEFNVIAYPNPSSDVFTFEVQSSGKGNTTTNVQVYDMTGRVIEQRQAASNSVEIGNNYPTGVYNVIVNQGENTKTLRVIKR